LYARASEHKAMLQEKAPAQTETADESPASTPPLRVYALGETRVLRGDVQLTNKDWGSLKARQLFFYMLSNTGQRREQISEIFWPDAGAEKARGAFHITAYRLRRARGSNDILLADGDRYQINRQMPLWYDVWEFERLLQEADQIEEQAPAAAAEKRREATDLVRGEFCEDLPDMEWQSELRHSIELSYLTALIKLGEYALAHRDPEYALTCFRRVLSRDDLREDAHRGVMRALMMAGDRGAALRHYRYTEAHIRQEMGAAPDGATTRLYRELASGRKT